MRVTLMILSFRRTPSMRCLPIGRAVYVIGIWRLERRVFSIAAHGKGQVNVVAFSPDGSQALSGGQDLAVRLWELPAGSLIREYKGSTSNIFAAGFSLDGRAVYAADQTRMLRAWNRETGELLPLNGAHSSDDRRYGQRAELGGAIYIYNNVRHRCGIFPGRRVTSILKSGCPQCRARLWIIRTTPMLSHACGMVRFSGSP